LPNLDELYVDISTSSRRDPATEATVADLVFALRYALQKQKDERDAWLARDDATPATIDAKQRKLGHAIYMSNAARAVAEDILADVQTRTPVTLPPGLALVPTIPH